MERRKEEEEEEEEEEGGGGKITKRSVRRAQATPYDRPAREQRKKRGGWLSKLLVEPASRILPSLFSSSSSRNQDSPPSHNLPEVMQDYDRVSTLISDNQSLQSKESGAFDELVGEKLGNADDGCGLAEIEQQLKQKMFSRDESNRLLELLRSRTTDLPDDDGHGAGFIVEPAEGTLSQKDLRTSPIVKHVLQSGRRMTWNTSDPLQSTPHDEVGSSPVEIAKAYMEALTSASDQDWQGERLKNEKHPFCNDDSVSQFSISSVVPKSPTCWPGAVVPSDHGYFTPQTQRGRIGIHNFPRTPYSRAVHSKSTSKFQGGDERPFNLSLAGSKQSSTPVFGGNMRLKTRNSVSDDGFPSIGPIRRVYQKNMATTASKSARPSNPASSFSLLSSSSDSSKGFTSTFQGNPEHGSSESSFLKFQSSDGGEVSRFTVGSSTVHRQSSEMARKILEHLDRNVPSPKEKSLELKLARERAKHPPKCAAAIMGDRHIRSDVSDSDDHNTGCLRGGNVNSQGRDAHKVSVEPSISKFSDESQLLSLPRQTSSKQGGLGLVHSSKGSEVFQIPKSLPHSSGSKSVLTFISVTRPSEKLKTYFDNGVGFTFPAPMTSNAIVEPPTPTMTPSLAANRLPVTNDCADPSFSFGDSSSGSGPVFSFGSIVSSTCTDTTTPKFTFGSDKKPSISFRSVGKDAICY